jgi:hypothetical protein
VRRWGLARARLAPIIGEDGFRVLFARSLHRTRGEHPWLARDAAKVEPIFASLKTSIESQTVAHARLGSRALRTNFTELLNALIGEELAAHLLGPL